MFPGTRTASRQCLLALEQHPEPPKRDVGRQMNHLRRVAFRSLVLLDHVRFQLVEQQLVEEDVVWNVDEDVVWNVWRSTQPAAVLVVEEDRLEARAVSVEKELVFGAVKELRPLATVPE